MADPNERERLAEEVGKLLDVPDLKIKDCFKVANLIIAEREKARAEAFALAVVIARSNAHGQPKMDGSTVYRNPSALSIARDIEQAATHTEGRDE